MSYDNCKHNSFRHKDAVSDFIDNQIILLAHSSRKLLSRLIELQRFKFINRTNIPGPPEKIKTPIQLTKLAANHGDKAIMFILARHYMNGEGTEKNLEKAFYWYQKAAENSNEKAMFYLAECYVTG
uniref:HCP-like protein n=1 Tax=Rhizophagus irregularis (strain DAOM 181602 / DAOM 197198 / MUCL 43194) TaxID=747089 RepID=U9SND5_RHIID